MPSLSASVDKPISLPSEIPADWIWQELVKCCRPRQWPTISKEQLLNEGFPVYGANGLIGYYSEYNHEDETIAVTCRGATCGTLNYVPAQSYITGNAMCLDDLDQNKITERYLYYALLHRGLSDVITGSAQPQITAQSLKKVTFPCPKILEQKKIAEILESVDDAIAKTEAVIAQTERVKQGLLQQLLTRGIGHTKFKQSPLGEIPESWELKELKDICIKVTDGSHQVVKTVDHGIPFLFVSCVRNEKIIWENCGYITQEVYNEISKGRETVKGAVLYTAVGSYGHAALVEEDTLCSFQRHIAFILDLLQKSVGFTEGSGCDSMLKGIEAPSTCPSLMHPVFCASGNFVI